MFKLIKQVIIMLSFGGSLATIVNTPDHIKLYPWITNSGWANLLLLIYILTNTLKDYVAIYLQLI